MASNDAVEIRETIIHPLPNHVVTGVENFVADATDPADSRLDRGEYARLKRLIQGDGLLNPQPRYYLSKIVLNAVLLGLGLLGLRLASLNLGWWLADVAFLAFVFVQIALLGHDVVHFQFVRAGRRNTALGLVLGNLLVGVSRGWWNDNHSAHHAHPNDIAADPNLDILFLACTPEQALSRPSWVQWIIRHQVALLIPIFCLEFFSMHQQSIAYALRRTASARAELWLIAAHWVLYGTVLLVAFGAGGALAFALEGRQGSVAERKFR